MLRMRYIRMRGIEHSIILRSCFKTLDQDWGQGAGWRKSGACTVCRWAFL